MWVRKRKHVREGAKYPAPPPAPKWLQKKRQSQGPFIGWTALAMMIVGSVGSLASTPPMAVFGIASVFLYVVPALLFLIPIALVAAELASNWPGGVFNWVRQGISPRMGLLAVWCEFAQTIFFYPTLLAYVASTLAYVIDPSLARNGIYNAAMIIALFWGGVLVTTRGAAFVAKLASTGTLSGTIIPAAALVVLGVLYLIRGNNSATPMNTSHLLPPWHGLASVVLVVNSFFTYAGVEVNAVHVDELRNPIREFPKAIFLAVAIVLTVFIVPTLAIAWVVPSSQISFTAGVMQAFDHLLNYFNIGFATPLIAIALAAGALAGMVSWLDGPSEGLLRIGREQGVLHPFFQKVNKNGIEVRILATQGIVITFIALLYALVPSVSRAFWVFTTLATQVYLIMYVLMFISAIKLRRSQKGEVHGYRAPVLGVLCATGILSSLSAFAIGFVPPTQLGLSSPVLYAGLLVVGILIVGIIPPFVMYKLRRESWCAAHQDPVE